MNIEGRSLLDRFGFAPPFKNRVVSYHEALRTDLDELYLGDRCGASIEVAPAFMKLSHGPNPAIKLSGAHNVPREQFYGTFERVVQGARGKGFPPSDLRFAICQSVPAVVTISGICARVDDDGFGYLACEIVYGVRRGDFTPDYSVADTIVGGRPMGHTRAVAGNAQLLPFWAERQMYRIMKKVNGFREGIAGVEFVLDTSLRRPIFHDMYWSLKPHYSLASKFHLPLSIESSHPA